MLLTVGFAQGLGPPKGTTRSRDLWAPCLCVCGHPIHYLDIARTVERSQIWGYRAGTLALSPVLLRPVHALGFLLSVVFSPSEIYVFVVPPYHHNSSKLFSPILHSIGQVPQQIGTERYEYQRDDKVSARRSPRREQR